MKALIYAAFRLTQEHPNFHYNNAQFQEIVFTPEKLDLYSRLLPAIWSVYKPALTQYRYEYTIAHDKEAIDPDKLQDLLGLLTVHPHVTVRLDMSSLGRARMD